MMGGDRTDLYGAGILQQNISNSLKFSNVYSNSKTYPIALESETSEESEKYVKTFCLNNLCETVTFSRICVEKLVNIILHQKLKGNVTHLLPRNVDSDLTVQGIVMYPKLKEYILPNEMNFQQYIFDDSTFQDIMVMYHNTVEFEWIKMLADEKNRLFVDNIF